MNFSGILTAGISFLVIGIFHPIVIRAEYYYTKRCWPVFLVAGACMPRTFCFCKAGNAIRIAGRSGMHVLVEHSGALRTGRACQKRLVSRKSKQTEIEQTFFDSYTF